MTYNYSKSNLYVRKRKKGERRYPKTYGKGWGQMTDFKNGFNDYYPLKKTAKEGKDFYKSKEWIETREKFKDGKELKCCKCGSMEHICVDHRLPLRRFWQYRHLEYNLQLLCHACNKEKLNHTDYNILREVKDKIRMDKDQKELTEEYKPEIQKIIKPKHEEI